MKILLIQLNLVCLALTLPTSVNAMQHLGRINRQLLSRCIPAMQPAHSSNAYRTLWTQNKPEGDDIKERLDHIESKIESFENEFKKEQDDNPFLTVLGLAGWGVMLAVMFKETVH